MLKRWFIVCCSWCLVCMPSLGWGWNALGHQVIWEMVAPQLTPASQQQVAVAVTTLKRVDERIHQPVDLGLWPDTLRRDGVLAFNRWHYTDHHYTPGRTRKSFNFRGDNSLTALKNAIAVLEAPHTTAFEKAFFLSFLIHVVGDIHQPLHNISLYNAQFSHGDAGGNRFLIQAPYAKNLHQYWDQGLNFTERYESNYPLSSEQIKQLALRLQQRYPESKLKTALAETDANRWSVAAYELAISYAYDIAFNAKPSQAYREHGRDISERQLVLAAHRLASLLNRLASAPTDED